MYSQEGSTFFRHNHKELSSCFYVLLNTEAYLKDPTRTCLTKENKDTSALKSKAF